MYKQQKYDEGVQKIQGYIDSIAGLDIARDIDKAYLQGKVNELGSKLKSVAAGDFSNYQLVNSVGGMATQIAKDPYVQNAVSSTNWYRKQTEKIQKEIEEGKSSPDNIFKFQKQANNWMSSTELGKKFSDSYIPFFDIFKFAKETFDEVLPDGYSFDQIYQMGADGKPITREVVGKNGKKEKVLVYSTTMTRLEKEGRFPKKVQETISQIFSDPRVSRQLGITGEYNYRNYDERMLAEKVNSQKESLLETYEEKLADLNIEKNSVTSAEGKKAIQDQIDAISQRMTTINENYNAYAKLANENPDTVRGKLYEDDVFSRYSTMFGKVVSKQQILENPAWRAEFEVQKEANAQSRWAQTEARERQEFRDDMDYKKKALSQAWDIAILNASTRGGKRGKGNNGLGTPEDLFDFTQGNQFSDTDVIYLEDRDYRNAAEDYNRNSVDLVWNAGFQDIPGNKKIFDNLVKSGKSPEEAKYTILKQLADKRKIPLEEFLTQYNNKVITTYNNLTPEQKQKNPILETQYKNFKQSLRNFEGQRVIRKQIDDQQEALFGKDVSRQTALVDIKDQKITFRGKEYELSKDDVYDLAVYLKGNLSVLGTMAGATDEGVRRAANSAAARLKLRGKEELLTGILDENIDKRAYKGGPITFGYDVVRGLAGVKDVYRQFRYGNDTMNPFQQVEKVFNVIDNENFAVAIKGRAEVIRRNYNIQPNLKAPLFTGDSDTDKELLYGVKGMVGGYSTASGGRINESGDFKEFAKAVNAKSDPSNLALNVQPTIGTDGQVKVEVVAYDGDKRIGGMIVQPDEAKTMGIDINTLYESKELSILRNTIKYNGGKSSNGNPSETSTYIQGDSWFDDNDFTQLKNSGFSAKGNIVLQNGLYFPYIYVTDGQVEKVRNLPGSPSLGAATSALTQVSPMFVKSILIEK
jgi:hypothetical protein